MTYAGREVLDIKRKDPDAELPFTIDWSAWLPSGQTISTSAWTADTGITIMSGANDPSKTGTAATVWLSGGTAGADYVVTNRIVTNGSPPLKDDRSFVVRVIQR